MNDSKLKMLVTQAVELDRQISEDADRLKEMKGQIALEAASRIEDAAPTEGGGTSITFEGLDGCICRVTTSGRSLKSSVDEESPLAEKVTNLIRPFIDELFTKKVKLIPIESFREKSASILPPAISAKLIKLCENPGKTTVSFETKEAS